MNTLLNDSDEEIEDRHGRRQDREITLGTTVILGIFFALAVLCAVFFGFGYSVGAKRATGTTLTAEANPNATFNNFKPAAGRSTTEPAGSTPGNAITLPLPVLVKSASGVRLSADQAGSPRGVEPSTEAAARTPQAGSAPSGPSGQSGSSAPPALPARPASAPALPAAVPAGTMMVQIAAVSHQEDADLLVSTLKRRGYAVDIHQEPQDKLLHVQIGPFATRKDADAMRLRLQADGFNAIVKDTAR